LPDPPVNVRPLQSEDIPAIYVAFKSAGWHRNPYQLEGYLDQQRTGERAVLVAYLDAEFAGCVTVKWRSDYPHFAGNGIPEIVDLNVMPPFQRRHIATALMDRAEALISQRSEIVGIRVGLFSDYGPAQRMYVLRGYVPDGRGVYYRDRQVKRLQVLPVDDDLVLYMVKRRDLAGRTYGQGFHPHP